MGAPRVQNNNHSLELLDCFVFVESFLQLQFSKCLQRERCPGTPDTKEHRNRAQTEMQVHRGQCSRTFRSHFCATTGPLTNPYCHILNGSPKCDAVRAVRALRTCPLKSCRLPKNSPTCRATLRVGCNWQDDEVMRCGRCSCQAPACGEGT